MGKLFYWSITVALSGFLFGFDTVVISGAEQTIQDLWNLSGEMHGLAISMALWGTVIGALLGGIPSQKWGRKKTLLWIGILFLLSALGSAFANDVYMFMFARFIGGIAIGVSTIAAPLFISEIAPPKSRGWLTGLFQFNIVFGIMIAFLSNALISDLGPNAWRWMLGIEAFPALAYTLMMIGCPESPRWLITKKQDILKATEIFKRANPKATDSEITKLVSAIENEKQSDQSKRGFLSKPMMKPILLAVLIAFFNQLSGINAVLYFAPRIFEMTGLGEQSALLQSIGIGVTNLLFTFLGLWLIDKLGRRTLLYIGSAGYIISLGLCAWAFNNEVYSIVPYCIFAFIASHAIGQGAVIWVFISEIFPNKFRAAGQTIGCFTHWFFAAALTLVFPKAVELLSPTVIFGIFCGMMVIQLIWVKLMVPETKGKSLEEVSETI